MSTWKRILCATDFSEPSRLAMLKAAELARRFDGDLELVHVVSTPEPVGLDVLAAPSEALETTVAELEEPMAGLSDAAAGIVGRPVRSVVLTGDPAGVIVGRAREEGVDVVVVGTHGRRGLRRIVLGSVAERVVREAPCEVIVVRPHLATEARETAEEIATYR